MGQKEVNIQKKIKIIYVGGGLGGVFGIRELYKKQINDYIDVELINPFEFSCYSGMLTGALCNYYKVEECFIDLNKVCTELNYTFTRQFVKKIIPLEKKLILDNGEERSFDILVVCTGSNGRGVAEVPGVYKFAIKSKPINFLYNDLEKKEKELGIDGNIVNEKKYRLGIVGGGICAFELAFCLNYRWRTVKKIKCDVTVFSGNVSISNTTQEMIKLAKDRGINCEFGRYVKEVKANGILFENGDFNELDAIIWAAGPVPPQLNAESGLDLCQDGWIRVNDHLQAVNFPNIFAFGDCIEITSHNGIVQKAGVYAVNESKVVSKNIKILVNNRVLGEDKKLIEYRPQKAALQLLSMGNQQCLRTKSNGFVLHGTYYYLLKKVLDFNFIHRFKQNPKKDWTYKLKI